MTQRGENSPPSSQESPWNACRFVAGRNYLVCVKQELMEPSLRMLWGSEKSWTLYSFWLLKILCSFPKAPSWSCIPLYILPDHHRFETAINPSSCHSPASSLTNSQWSREKVTTPLRAKSQSSSVCFVWDSKVIVLCAVWQPLMSLGFISHTWCSFVEGIGRDFAFLWWDDMSLYLNLFHMTHLTWLVSRRFTCKGQEVFQLRLQSQRVC